jgi:hypothetical protein
LKKGVVLELLRTLLYDVVLYPAEGTELGLRRVLDGRDLSETVDYLAPGLARARILKTSWIPTIPDPPSEQGK